MAEDLAQKHGVTKDEADEFALKSHKNWKVAQEAKVFDDESISLVVNLNKKQVLVSQDELSQSHTKSEDFSQAPVLLEGGTIITQANSSTAADGAAALLLANEESVNQQDLKPLARISGWASVGVNPEEFGLGTIAAVRRLLADQGLKVDHVDLYELNEMFAPQVVIAIRELNIDPERVNVNGGAISMGHPVAATGARMVTHLVHQMRRRNLKRGIAASSCGGGQGVAIMLENVN